MALFVEMSSITFFCGTSLKSIKMVTSVVTSVLGAVVGALGPVWPVEIWTDE